MSIPVNSITGLSANLGTFSTSNKSVMFGGSGHQFDFTHDGQRYGFNAPVEDHDRALELIGEGEVDEIAMVELNLMFDVQPYRTGAGLAVFDAQGVMKIRVGIW